MSSTTLTPRDVAVQAQLPDVLPPRRARGRVGTFIYRHPTIFAGGLLLGIMIGIAIFAPYLGTVDPTALAPARRTRPGTIRWPQPCLSALVQSCRTRCRSLLTLPQSHHSPAVAASVAASKRRSLT